MPLQGNEELSLELSLSEVRKAALAIGFQLEREQTGLEAAYTAAPRSMFLTVYRASFWTMRKPG
jgi:carnosine N-methyltransferase